MRLQLLYSKVDPNYIRVHRTLVNGQSISEKTQLHHGARILLGNHHLYRLSCPRQTRESTATVELMDYEQAMKEISLKELDKGTPLSSAQLTSVRGHLTPNDLTLRTEELRSALVDAKSSCGVGILLSLAGIYLEGGPWDPPPPPENCQIL